MAEEEEEERSAEGGGEEPTEEPSSRLPHFIVLVFAILLGQATAGYYLITEVYGPGVIQELEEEAEAAKKLLERPVFEIDQPLLFEIGEMVMNPPDDEATRFLNAMVTIEVDTPEVLAVFDDKLVAAQLYDLVFGILATTDFLAMDEADEREAIKQNLRVQINGSPLLEEMGEVTNVYFERFLLQ
ncbi:MAG: flagellar basal body-associated FliL family protein [Candidatus Latescibacterota bacterium]|nr:flagellar basal body-associated FliL family protein [Candidatus Latescibacterota bacterium]